MYTVVTLLHLLRGRISTQNLRGERNQALTMYIYLECKRLEKEERMTKKPSYIHNTPMGPMVLITLEKTIQVYLGKTHIKSVFS